jgi:hypothetical protein
MISVLLLLLLLLFKGATLYIYFYILADNGFTYYCCQFDPDPTTICL